VRELENVVLRVYTLADSATIGLQELLMAEPAIGGAGHRLRDGQLYAGASFRHAKACAMERFEQDYLTRLLQQANGNVTEAAKLAGKERRSLGKLLKKYHIERAPHRS
jgi:DNA-binding NtrC family response regulator